VELTPVQVHFLTEQRTGHLATVDPWGQPHVVPVCFALLHGCLYTPIDEKPKRVAGSELRRVRNIEFNPRVCLAVDRYAEDWARLAWLQLRGKAVVIPRASGHRDVLEALRERYSQYRAMDLESAPLIEIQPDAIVSCGAL
jgi:PPOX class probable F420-dependent enzyme